MSWVGSSAYIAVYQVKHNNCINCWILFLGRRRQYHEEKEPEWFSCGPTSQNDTIELRGFEKESEHPTSVKQSNKREDNEKPEQNSVEGTSKGMTFF